MYNTERPPLVIKEYGRNIQKLVDYTKRIVDPDKRQVHVEYIVELIMKMYPPASGLEDYRLKIWSHVLMMGNYELDVKTPENVPLETDSKQPKMIPYPRKDRKYRHYGRNVQKLIDKALNMEDGPGRQEFIGVIGSYMKMVQTEANQEDIDDKQIREDLDYMTEGRLHIPDHFYLDGLIHPRNRRSDTVSNGGRHSNSRRRR